MKDSYKAMQLPSGVVPALGVQTKGGGFFGFIGASAVPPASASALFTTVLDGQTEVAIKVMAVLPDDPTPLMIGSFELAEIPPAKACVPQVRATAPLPRWNADHGASHCTIHPRLAA